MSYEFLLSVALVAAALVTMFAWRLTREPPLPPALPAARGSSRAGAVAFNLGRADVRCGDVASGRGAAKVTQPSAPTPPSRRSRAR